MTTPQHPIGSGFGYRSTAAEVLEGIDLAGRLAIVTGGYSGLGLETVRALSGAGAEVVVPARRPRARRGGARGHRAASRSTSSTSATSTACAAFAERFLDRAAASTSSSTTPAIMACPETRVGPGWEAQFATNHLGHFALANLLWPLLAAGGGARVVALSSTGHKLSGDPLGRPAVRARLRQVGRPTGRRRPPTRCSPSSSTRSARTPACARSRPTPAGSSRRSSATCRARRWSPRAGSTRTATPTSASRRPSRAPRPRSGRRPRRSSTGMGGVYCEDCDIAAPTDAGLADRAHRGRRRPRDRPARPPPGCGRCRRS